MAEKEYIEREAILSVCEQVIEDDWNTRTAPDSWKDAYESFIDDIKETPTADVQEVRHGKWEFACNHNHKQYFRCSECGYCYEIFENTQYCQHCGARMSKE